MGNQRKFAETREQIERTNEQLEELKEPYDLDSEDEVTGEIGEVPASCRTDWEERQDE